MFWKKWVPWLGSILNPSIPYSTTILAAEMSVQLTGTPNVGIDEPHLPGPIRKYDLPSLSIREFIAEISSAICLVFSLSKTPGSMATMRSVSWNNPLPRALSLVTRTVDNVLETSSIEVFWKEVLSDTGLTWSSSRAASRPDVPFTGSRANSISTSDMSSFRQMSMISDRAVARGNLSYWNIPSNEITLGPLTPIPGCIRSS